MTEAYETGKIYGWNGGDCPVHREAVVKYWLRVGFAGEGTAEYFRWDHKNSANDIIAFLVVKQHVKPKVIWVNEYDDTGFYSPYATEEEAIKKASSKATRIAVKYVECKE